MSINIHDRRKELNLTLEDIGKAVGVSKSTVKKWESGFIKNMRRDKIILLAKIPEVSPIDILKCSEKAVTLPKSQPATQELDDIYRLLANKLKITTDLENSMIIYTKKRFFFLDINKDLTSELAKII